MNLKTNTSFRKEMNFTMQPEVNNSRCRRSFETEKVEMVKLAYSYCLNLFLWPLELNDLMFLHLIYVFKSQLQFWTLKYVITFNFNTIFYKAVVAYCRWKRMWIFFVQKQRFRRIGHWINYFLGAITSLWQLYLCFRRLSYW